MKLHPAEVRNRATRVQLLVTDCDGVLTDAGVWYSERGEELKRFSLRDGMGVELLRNAGIATGILTREDSPVVRRRVEKLRLEHYWPGVEDKAAWLAGALADLRLDPGALAYIGDDVNDVELLRAIGEHGLTAAPGDAAVEAQRAAQLHCTSTGGHGAFREFADFILRSRKEDVQ